MAIIRAQRWSVEVPKIKAAYYRHATAFQAGGDTTPGDQRASFVPFYLPPCTIDRIGVHCSVLGSAGAVVRLGLYLPGPDDLPLSLAVDGGTVSCTTTGTKEVTVSFVHGGGLIFGVSVPQGAPGTPIQFRAYNIGTNASPVLMTDTLANATNANWVGYRQDTFASGALPGSAGTMVLYEGCPRIYVRCS